ncbi:hypothetical protein EOD39_2363 [Acipenser ruthenus]|uniref:Uncharacterized protein n=1 Tax=Acipenser ruthenus TaxID=7906 RepID=A0A444U1Z2_ACIRT|nr:hypothetical protein EOD39_2363 [Acipenser ruthenus]
MNRAALSALLEALDNRQESTERRREERYMALIERVGLAIQPTVPTAPVMTAPKARPEKMTAEDDPDSHSTRKTNKERQIRKWEGALMRRGWGLVEECKDGNKHHSKGVAGAEEDEEQWCGMFACWP